MSCGQFLNMTLELFWTREMERGTELSYSGTGKVAAHEGHYQEEGGLETIRKAFLVGKQSHPLSFWSCVMILPGTERIEENECTFSSLCAQRVILGRTIFNSSQTHRSSCLMLHHCSIEIENCSWVRAHTSASASPAARKKSQCVHPWVSFILIKASQGLFLLLFTWIFLNRAVYK
jgi:hypothetical protein